MNKYIVIVFGILFVFICQASAETYKYVDKDGNLAFTDDLTNVPNNQRKKVQKLNQEQIGPEPSGKRSPPNQPASMAEAYNQGLEKLKSCPKETKEEKEKAIKLTWDKMRQAITSRDKKTALTYTSVFRNDNLRRFLSELNADQLPILIEGIKTIRIESQEEFSAEVEIIREENGKDYSYPAEFLKDVDCQWRINRF